MTTARHIALAIGAPHRRGGDVASRIEASIRDIVFHRLRRRGVVVGLSGGIDSSVVGALAARALGPSASSA